MILCVDPAPDDRRATRETLSDAGFDTEGCATAAAALDVLRDADSPAVDCLVTEHALDDGTGLELVERTRAVAPDTACVLFTDASLDDVDTAAFGDAVAEYLRKGGPNVRDELVSLVEYSVSVPTQTAYPLPDDEDARVAALDRYASDPDGLGAALDRLTALASVTFDVDSAAVGLIDAHHERFLSCHGASFGTLDREDTACTYAILDDGVTVVEDASADPRFSENEGMTAAGVRFYAGAPLLTPDGHAIGVFCLHDDVPREFGSRDRNHLRQFADEAMEQLELRRRLREANGSDGEDAAGVNGGEGR